MKMYKSILATALGLASVGALAATDGTLELGSTGSSGDFDIDLDIPALVLVTGLDDIDLLEFSPGSDSNDSATFCVYSNQATVDVDVLVEPGNTPGAGTAPVLQSVTTGDEIPYELDLDGSAGNLIDNVLAAGSTAANVDDATDGVATSLSGTPGSYTCTENFTFDVTVTQAAAGSVTAATDYTDTVTVTVTAN